MLTQALFKVFFLYVVCTVYPVNVFLVVTSEKMRKKSALLCTSFWTDSGCGGPQELSEDSGTFTSGNYPSNYDNGKGCTWHISVHPDKV